MIAQLNRVGFLWRLRTYDRLQAQAAAEKEAEDRELRLFLFKKM